MDGCRVGRKGRLEQRWMDVEWGGRRKTGAEVDGCRVGWKGRLEQRWMDGSGERRKTGAEVDGCRVGRKGRLEQRWMDVEWGEKEDWSRGGWM